MPDTAIQLLNSASQTMADVASRMDKSMSQQLAIQQQAHQFEVDTTMKGLQFGEMSRMNDAQIQNMKDQNYLAAQKFELEQELRPKMVETQRLQMEAYAARAKADMDMRAQAATKDIFGVWNDYAGRQILHTGNPDHAKEYLGYMADVTTKMRMGEKIDNGLIKGQIDAIADKYKDKIIAFDDKRNYTPEESMLFHSISKPIGDIYDKNNPVIKRIEDQLSVNYYNVPQDQASEWLNKFGAALGGGDKTKIGEIEVNRDQFQLNKKIIENAEKQAYAYDKISLDPEKSDTVRKDAMAKAKEKLAERDKLMEDNRKMIRDTLQGNYLLNKANTDKVEKPVVDVRKVGESEKIFGIETNNTKDPTLKIIAKNVTSFAQIFINQETEDGKQKELGRADTLKTELRFLDDRLGWFQQNKVKDIRDPNTIKDIKEKVDQGVDATYKNGEGLAQQFTKEKFDKILSNVDRPIPIEVSEFVSDIVHKGKAKTQSFSRAISGDPDTLKSISNAGRITIGKSGNVEGFDDVMKIIGTIDNQYEREVVIKELYSCIVTAGLASRLERK